MRPLVHVVHGATPGEVLQYRYARGEMNTQEYERRLVGPRRHPNEEDAMKVTDPVCGMEFKEEKAVAKVEYQGTTYYFCTDACRRQFEQEPAKYVPSEGGVS